MKQNYNKNNSRYCFSSSNKARHPKLADKKQQFNSLDFAKFVAALFVVAIHSQPFSGLVNDIVINVLARIAVPFFFLVSSFFFFRRNPDKEQLYHYIKRLLLLYAFWFCIEFPITFLHLFIEPDRPIFISLLILVRNFLFSSTFQGSWFIIALIEGVSLVWWISRRLSNRSLVVVGVVIFFGILIQTTYFSLLPLGFQRVFSFFRQAIGPVELSFFSGFLFIVIGKIIGDNEQELYSLSKKKISLCLIICLLLSVTEVLWIKYIVGGSISNDVYFMLVPLTPLLFTFIIQFQLEWSIDYIKWRNYSTLFFFSHFIFVFIFVIINKHVLPIPPLLKYVLVLFCCFFTSSFIRRLSKSNKFSWLRYSF